MTQWHDGCGIARFEGPASYEDSISLCYNRVASAIHVCLNLEHLRRRTGTLTLTTVQYYDVDSKYTHAPTTIVETLSLIAFGHAVYLVSKRARPMSLRIEPLRHSNKQRLDSRREMSKLHGRVSAGIPLYSLDEYSRLVLHMGAFSKLNLAFSTFQTHFCRCR